MKNNPKIENNIDPTDELLRTLIKDINLDEHELKSISEMNNEFQAESGDSVETEMASKDGSMPDGLDLTVSQHTGMIIPGMQRGGDDDADESLAYLLNNNFESDQSQIRSSIKPENTEVSSIQFKQIAKEEFSAPSIVPELSLAIPEAADEDIVQINDPTIFNKAEDLRDPELLRKLGNSSEHREEKISLDYTDLQLQNESLESVSQVFTSHEKSYNEKTVALAESKKALNTNISFSDKTVAVAGFSDRFDQNLEEKVKVSIGQVRTSPLSSWNKADSNLSIAHSMELAQDKIVSLEKENEVLRQQNEELVAAAEIIKERADMLASEMNFLKNDRDSLEQSFKNELMIVRSQLNRKDSEIQKVNAKAEELDSRLKFDMKKIRVRERELENRLELLRAEKNALVKSKDEMILDLRRKCDQFQLETESFRQKCIELNKSIESNQDSVKRTTRALRLAMANLELQDEAKPFVKKAE